MYLYICIYDSFAYIMRVIPYESRFVGVTHHDSNVIPHDPFHMCHVSFIMCHDSFDVYHDSFSMYHDLFVMCRDSFNLYYDSVKVYHDSPTKMRVTLRATTHSIRAMTHSTRAMTHSMCTMSHSTCTMTRPFFFSWSRALHIQVLPQNKKKTLAKQGVLRKIPHTNGALPPVFFSRKWSSRLWEFAMGWLRLVGSLKW